MSQIYWRTSGKRLIKIADMTTEHLKNALKYFHDLGDFAPPSRDEALAEMELELEYREQVYEGIEPIPPKPPEPGEPPDDDSYGIPENKEVYKDMAHIATAIKLAEPYKLEIEVLAASMKYLKEHPEATIAEATDAGVGEWIK